MDRIATKPIERLVLTVGMVLIALAAAMAAPVYDADNKAYAAENWLWPVPDWSGGLSRGYSADHDGQDILQYAGAPIVAAKSGTVARVLTPSTQDSNWQGYGYGVVINHGDGYFSHYAHMSGVSVSEGQSVSRGQKIGTMGQTGNATGVHLHFAIATSVYGGGGRINNNRDAIAYDYKLGYNPSGCLDHVYVGDGMIKVSGWAFDKDDENANTRIDVYVDGPDGKGEHPGNTVANMVRADVNRAKGVTGNHGFEASFVTKMRGKVTVKVYAINVGSGSNVLIGTRDVNITYPAYGYLDHAYDAKGAVRVTGWAYDKDHPNANIDVHVYIGGPAGTGERHVIKANQVRADVNKTMGITGNHGFDTTITTSKRGTVKVYAYGISMDGAPLNNNPQLINVQTVTITNPVKSTKNTGTTSSSAATSTNSGTSGLTAGVPASSATSGGKSPVTAGPVASKTVAKKANTLTVKVKKSTASFKYAKVKKKSQSMKLSKLVKVSKAKGKVTYAKKSGNKKISVKNGKLVVKKGLKKGTYKVKVAVKAAGNASYEKATKIVTLKVKVK